MSQHDELHSKYMGKRVYVHSKGIEGKVTGFYPGRHEGDQVVLSVEYPTYELVFLQEVEILDEAV